MTKQEPSVQREKKKCMLVLETGKGGAQDAIFLENPSEIPSVAQGVNFRNHWRNSLSFPRSQLGTLSQPEEGSLRNQLKVTISPGAELLPSSVKRSAVYDLKMILSKLICQESPIEKAIRGFKWVNMKLLNCYCVFLFFSVKSWTMSQHQHEGGETYNNHISSGKWSLFGWCLSKSHILLGKKGNTCFVGWP